MTALRAGASTDIGLVRAVNQDRLLVTARVCAVADGMGGHAAGEVASQTAVRALRAALDEVRDPEMLAEAVRAANRAVWDQAQANPDFRGMGTTLTALALVGAGTDATLAIANVGDSRTYRLRGDAFEQLTVDHSLVAEMVAGGQIAEQEAETHPQRHVLTRALGVYPDVDVDLLTTDPEPGDRYLLCSDGLSGEVTDAQIASILRRLADPDDAARELIAEARHHGGNDNITVVVVDVVSDAEGGGGADPSAGRDDPAGGTTTAGDGDPHTVASGSDNGASSVGAAAAGEGDDPAVATQPAAGRSRRQRRALRRHVVDSRPRNRPITIRVVGFFVLLVAVAAAAVGGTAWYARAGYYVGLRDGRITIYQGRPGGVLWWQPTVKQVTPYTADDVESYHLPALRSGVEEPTLRAATVYVANLRNEARAAGIGGSG